MSIHPTPTSKNLRAEQLTKFVNRVQRMLAHRSVLEQPFTRLYPLMRTKRLAEIALEQVLRNPGARTAGVDGISKRDLSSFEARTQLINELNRELTTKTYQPQPVRRIYLPKPNGELRPLGIPTLRDRIVQEMLRLILEPIYEGRFHKHSYGFRPTRSAHHAVARLHPLIARCGYNVVIEGDIRKCFDRIQHHRLLALLRKTIKDESLIHLIAAMLKAGVMEDDAWHVTDEGTPQGGIISPLLANIYLNELDQFIAAQWENLSPVERKRQQKRKETAPCFIVRYADDFVVLCKDQDAATKLKTDIAAFLDRELHLELSNDKTRITSVTQGFDFLGFNLRRYATTTLIHPSQKALKRFRQTVKRKAEEGFRDNDVAGVTNLNRYLVGWGNYYSKVSSKKAFGLLDYYVWWQVWKITRRLRSTRRSKSARKFYQTHYLPFLYRCSTRKSDRKYRGRHYGAWADEQHTQAYIITRLAFIPIRYTRFHSQQHPYLPATSRTNALEIVQLPNDDQDYPVGENYGREWQTIRRTILRRDEYRCRKCGSSVSGYAAHVHHLTKRRTLKRKQAHYLENLVTLCPSCHRQADS